MKKLWGKKHLKKKTDIFRNNIFQEHLSTAVDLKRKRYAQTERCLETEYLGVVFLYLKLSIMNFF